MISTQDRSIAVELINEARENGARLKPACEILNITDRTYQRWTQDGKINQDQRPLIKRPTPKNKITEEERSEIIETVNTPEYADLVPSQIVPKLATEGKYIASESTFYRVLKKEKLNTHRSRAKVSIKREPPSHVATSPNQVWTWDITWLNASVKGQYFKLYLILDMFSRLIVGHEVWKEEKAEHAEYLIRKTTLAQGIDGRPLVLHSDNGSPMKAATFQTTLEKLGVQSSFSRPRVSNDNPYSESLFKTMKYRPGYPFKGFTSLEDSRIWVDKFVKNHFLSHPEILKRKNEHSRELIINVRRGDFYSQENINVYGFDIVNFVALCLHNLHEFDFESYVVYSDDIPWCKANLAALNVAGKELTYKNNLTPEEVFFDLASAKNIILSNSTFCYWAAYISTFLYGEKSIVLGPNFGNRKEGFYLPKQYLPQWHVIADFDYESPYK